LERDGVLRTMCLHFDGQSIVRAGGKRELACGEPAVVECIEAGSSKNASAGKNRDRAAAAECSVRQIDGAAQVTEIGRAGGGVEAAARFGGPGRKREPDGATRP